MTRFYVPLTRAQAELAARLLRGVVPTTPTDQRDLPILIAYLEAATNKGENQ